MGRKILLFCAVLVWMLWRPPICAGFTEPWQAWQARPSDVPLFLLTSVDATAGTDVNLKIAGNTFANAGGSLNVNTFVSQLNPREQYTLEVSGLSVTSVKIQFQPYIARQILARGGNSAKVRPYRVTVNKAPLLEDELNVAFGGLGNHATNYLIEIHPDQGFQPAALCSLEDRWSRDEDRLNALAPGDAIWPELGPGRDTNAAVGSFRWGVNLGKHWNGTDCGMIRLNEKTLGTNLFSEGCLTYTAKMTNTAEVMVITNGNGKLRQVRVPQGFVDIASTTTPNAQCIMKFYLLSQVSSITNSSGLFTVSDDNPFVVWRIKNPNTYASGIYTNAQFIEERPGRTNVSEIQYAGGTANAWILKMGSGSDLRTEKRTVAISGQSRTETVEILDALNAPAYKAEEKYRQYPWGWELTNVVSNPGGNGLTNSFTYYEDANEPTAYRKLKDRLQSGGRWERWYYAIDGLCPSWTSQFGGTGALPVSYTEIRVRPWKDSPSSATGATLANSVQEFTTYHSASSFHPFTPSYSYYYKDPRNITNMFYYGWDKNVRDLDLLNITFEYRSIHFNERRTTRHDNPGNYLHDMLDTVEMTRSQHDNYQYYKGVFSWADYGFSPNETAGSDIKCLLTHATQQSAGLYGFAYDSTDYGWWYSVNEPGTTARLGGYAQLGKSTQEIGVHQKGNLVYKETLAMESIAAPIAAPVFLPIERQILSYDSLGHLTNIVWKDAKNASITRTVYQASWIGSGNRDCELKAWEINETGQKTTYAYDSLKRLTNTVLIGVAASADGLAQSDIATNLVYDAVSRVRLESVSAGTLNLSKTNGFDFAGRLVKSSGFDSATTDYAYSADTLSATETRPGGINVVRTTYLDGRLKSVTGSGVVSQYMDYLVTDDFLLMDVNSLAENPNCPKNITRTYFGAANSSRYSDRVFNKGNILVQERCPGFGPTARVLTTTYWRNEANSDLLAQKYVPVKAYDSVNGLITVDSAEYYTVNAFGETVKTDYGLSRSTSRDSLYENDSSGWFLVTYESLNQATNVTRQRLSGFTSTNTIADIQLTDPDNNVTQVYAYLDLAAKKVTTVTNTPQSTLNITNIQINGLVQSANSESEVNPARFYYDSLGRLIAVKDSLNNVTGTLYETATGWVSATTNAAGKVTSYEYQRPNEANAGKLKCRTGPNAKKTYYAYTDRGELWRTWGDVPYPEERVYNAYGDMTGLHTYQEGASWSSASWPGGSVAYQTNTWNYDVPTGLLLSKVDGSGRGYTNDYWPEHTFKSRTSARNVTATYLFNDCGDLVQTTYSDGSPAVTLGGINSFGQPTQVDDALGTRSLSYDFAGRLTGVSWGSPLSNLSLNNRIDPVYGRDRITVDGIYSGGNSYVLTQNYGYDAATGRLNLASESTFNANYTYKANSDLLETVTHRSGTTPILASTRSWAYGYRLTGITNTVNSVSVVSHAYTYDDADRRTMATLQDGSYWTYGYDDRDEIVSGVRRFSDASAVAGQQYQYQYDAIGNRKTSGAGGNPLGNNLRPSYYTTNGLNQYSGRTVPATVDIVGEANASATVTVNSQPTTRHGNYYHGEPEILNTGGPVYQGITNLAVLNQGSNPDIVGTNIGSVFLPKNPQIFLHDAEGNLTNDGQWSYIWDAENRLATMFMTNFAGVSDSARLKLDFGYDYMGRRVKKTVSAWSGGNYQGVSTNYFVYDNWNLIAEVQPDANEYLWLKKSYLWGQDLAGRLADGDGNAGGIGGLAMVTDYSGSVSRHFACYDGNGNIAALVNAADGTATARYEYGPFGELIRATGPMAKTNPFRFSTKFCDDESGLVYYGYRYYSPTMGRFINRDPIEEEGGNNLYAFVGNNPINYFDTDGRKKLSVIEIIDILVNALRAATGQDLEEGGTKVAQEIQEALDQGGKKISGPIVPGGGKGVGKVKKPIFVFKGNLEVAKKVRSGIKLKTLAAIGYIGYITSGQSEVDSASFANNSRDYYINVLRGDTPMADLDAAMIAIDALNLFGNEGVALEIWSSLP